MRVPSNEGGREKSRSCNWSFKEGGYCPVNYSVLVGIIQLYVMVVGCDHSNVNEKCK